MENRETDEIAEDDTIYYEEESAEDKYSIKGESAENTSSFPKETNQEQINELIERAQNDSEEEPTEE